MLRATSAVYERAENFCQRENVSIEVDERWLRMATVEMAARDFKNEATAPGEFQEFPVTDGWLAAQGTPKPPMANVPSAAPDETTLPPQPDKSRWLNSRWGE